MFLTSYSNNSKSTISSLPSIKEECSKIQGIDSFEWLESSESFSLSLFPVIKSENGIVCNYTYQFNFGDKSFVTSGFSLERNPNNMNLTLSTSEKETIKESILNWRKDRVWYRVWFEEEQKKQAHLEDYLVKVQPNCEEAATPFIREKGKNELTRIDCTTQVCDVSVIQNNEEGWNEFSCQLKVTTTRGTGGSRYFTSEDNYYTFDIPKDAPKIK